MIKVKDIFFNIPDKQKKKLPATVNLFFGSLPLLLLISVVVVANDNKKKDQFRNGFPCGFSIRGCTHTRR